MRKREREREIRVCEGEREMRELDNAQNWLDWLKRDRLFRDLGKKQLLIKEMGY